ncbi:hypothetical protein [Alkaliphilus sp. B6464]|uniref:hypothetical protein n=1 Tax=Alkaliphilus sp. B6464 TaxID=2731219 RepID=UPI001BA8E982|nr:hypothetical protein [Alkaliphilus sp. B6464]QUH20356.1 hypothetical protein HYG84_10915 [Alkaliphilus sp. B6464]
MKKTIVGIIVIAIVFVIGIYSDFGYSGSIRRNITSKESANSEVTFDGKKGDTIKFVCNSSIKEGNLKLTLTNSNGKVIKNFRTNKNYSEQVSLDKDGEYILSATYDNFIGNFHIKCR